MSYPAVADNYTLLNESDRSRFRVLQLVRSALIVLITLFVARTTDLGTPLLYVTLIAVLGGALAGRLLSKGNSFLTVLALHVGLWLLLSLILYIVNLTLIGGGDQSSQFSIYRFSDHLVLLGIFYSAAFLSTWFFWTTRPSLTFEAVFMSALFVWFLQGHRNYQLDAPKRVSELAWRYGFEMHHFILGLGAVFTIILAIYLYLSSTRPIYSSKREIRTLGRSKRIFVSALPSLFLLVFLGYVMGINRFYSFQLDRAANGVGTESQEGQSPLGFHSAVGKTKQPAALVRLEGDYENNPWKPMLYMREGSLSDFNGRELVLAAKDYDQDVPRIAPGQPYTGLGENKLQTESGVEARSDLLQSVYLLTQHSGPFAVDYPESIRTIKNPDPARFQVSYQALSHAPILKIEDLANEEVGEQSWSEVDWAHYLRAPGSLTIQEWKTLGRDVGTAIEELQGANDPRKFSTEPILDKTSEDLRYLAMSHALTKGYLTPVAKAIAISSFLSEESIYTRSPGHQVTAQGDPVTPYLFSNEKRGYCVHFAHAAAFMMRLAGIPARIATGYLTDLNYAKDGHVLLHLGDRHAWPEIYIRGVGWMVVDVQPQRAENEQTIIPDEKLLEELMSKIDPAQELPLPKQLDLDDTSDFDSTGVDPVVLRRFFQVGLAVTVTAWLLLVFVTHFGYRFVPAAGLRIRLAYSAFAAEMSGLGLVRTPGETRSEFATRLSHSHGVRAEKITNYQELRAYAREAKDVDVASLRTALSESSSSYDSSGSSRWRRICRVFGLFNPATLFRLGRW